MKKLGILLMHENATLPTRGTAESAGLDLYAIEDFEIPASRTIGGAVKIGRYVARTGIGIELQPGFEGSVRPRSGHAFNETVNVTTHDGTIDSDYRGEIKVLMYNMGHKPVQFKEGQKIAQLIISPVVMCEPTQIKKFKTTTERGEGGFGHTGI